MLWDGLGLKHLICFMNRLLRKIIGGRYILVIDIPNEGKRAASTVLTVLYSSLQHRYPSKKWP
jgi:hypothetical protein